MAILSRSGHSGSHGFTSSTTRLALTLVLATAASLASAADLIGARIGDEPVVCPDMGADRPAACAAALLRQLRSRAERQYIQDHGLHAEEAEIAAVRAYERDFALHDREQRARKLDELETRLAHMDTQMSNAEREWLLQFRAVLQRLAVYDADVERGIEMLPQLPAATIAHWIEQAKLDAALYRRYGGVVGIRPSGPYAHAARAALVAEYMRSAEVELVDQDVEQHLRVQLHQPPTIVQSGAAPDFTPFWQRPLVPSYVGP
jgi:hypothetical protein